MIEVVQNGEFLTTYQQKILLLLYYQKEVNFKTQGIYKSQTWFRREMSKLVKFQKIDRRNGIAKDGRKHEESYTINVAGKIFVEQFIMKYQERLK